MFLVCSISQAVSQTALVKDLRATGMSELARAVPVDALDVDVQEALEICGGDPMKALRATLIANAFLEAEVDRLSAAVSAGFARGKVRKAPPLKEAKKKTP